MNKFTSILLIIALLASMAGCGAAETTETIAETETTTETTAAETEDTRVRDNLPSDLDLGGESVSFLYREEVAAEFCSEELNGELVNDGFYNSHLAVENRLNTEVSPILVPGHHTSVRQGYMDSIRKSVTAGDSQYDWVDLMIGNSTVLMGEGLFLNLADNRYIETEQPWYLTDMMEQASIDNRLYFISGDASLGYLKCTYCIYYNQELAETYQVGDLYEIVHNGQWTVDKVREIAEIACADTDGNGTYDLNDDLGFVLHDYYQYIGFIGSCDAPIYDKDTDGVWQLSFGDDRDTGVCDTLYRFSNETAGVFMSHGTELADATEYGNISAKFIAGDILMLSAEMDDINSKLRDIDVPYGVLPYPKYDEAQKDYCNISRNTQNAFSMPKTCQNPDAAGAVMEALSCENYNTILPAYFETSMKVKYSGDNETAKMFDLIKESTRLTFWYTYNNAIGDAINAVYFVSTIKANGEGTLASKLASQKTKLETSLSTYLDKIAGLEG